MDPLLYNTDVVLKQYYLFCENCLRRLPDQVSQYKSMNQFIMLHPRTNPDGRCHRLLGTMKNVVWNSEKTLFKFRLNLTPADDNPVYCDVVLTSVPGINADRDVGGDLVAEIVNDPYNVIGDCKKTYYDVYFFGPFVNIPQCVAVDLLLLLSSLYWKPHFSSPR
jgi:hypothetical protein